MEEARSESGDIPRKELERQLARLLFEAHTKEMYYHHRLAAVQRIKIIHRILRVAMVIALVFLWGGRLFSADTSFSAAAVFFAITSAILAIQQYYWRGFQVLLLTELAVAWTGVVGDLEISNRFSGNDRDLLDKFSRIEARAQTLRAKDTTKRRTHTMRKCERAVRLSLGPEGGL